jgi:hypothetical protein
LELFRVVVIEVGNIDIDDVDAPRDDLPTGARLDAE